jgi:hypothetical protein
MRNYLKTFNILSNEDIDVFESKVIRKTLKKGDYFIQEGKTSKVTDPLPIPKVSDSALPLVS